jgi:hypothetical protein
VVEGEESNIGVFAKRVADGFLLEAKGNSGVIFSQFLLGLAQSLEGKIRVTVQEFASAMKHAIKRTYEAIEKPKEGTILTVIRETAEEAENVAKNNNNFIIVLEKALKKARESLERTREILPSLKKAGVVDAGGWGFVLFFEGLVEALKGRKLELPQVEIEDRGEHPYLSSEETEHRYCTEAIIESDEVDGNKLKNLLRTLGGSLIVVGAGKLFHIHIHTNIPQRVISILREKGRLIKEKIDDMFAQNLGFSKKEVGIITDSTSDMPLDLALEYGIEVVPQQIIIGDEAKRDGIDISREEILKRLLEEDVKMTTSQASPQDFIIAYKKSAERAKALLVLAVSSGLSGTIKSAEIAASNIEIPVHIVDTKRISFAEALLALRASDKVKEGWSAERIKEYLDKLIPLSYFLFTIDTFKYIVRSGRLGWRRGKVAEFLRIKPIMTLDGEGRIIKKSKAFGKRGVIKKVISLMDRELPKDREYDFAIAYINTPEIVDELKPYIEKNFKIKRFLTGQITPVIALHTGPGAWGVFALPYLEEDKV